MEQINNAWPSKLRKFLKFKIRVKKFKMYKMAALAMIKYQMYAVGAICF
jgi:hypothetical protein